MNACATFVLISPCTGEESRRKARTCPQGSRFKVGAEFRAKSVEYRRDLPTLSPYYVVSFVFLAAHSGSS